LGQDRSKISQNGSTTCTYKNFEKTNVFCKIFGTRGLLKRVKMGLKTALDGSWRVPRFEKRTSESGPDFDISFDGFWSRFGDPKWTPQPTQQLAENGTKNGTSSGRTGVGGAQVKCCEVWLQVQVRIPSQK
jgi:hypothetical protein